MWLMQHRSIGHEVNIETEVFKACNFL